MGLCDISKFGFLILITQFHSATIRFGNFVKFITNRNLKRQPVRYDGHEREPACLCGAQKEKREKQRIAVLLHRIQLGLSQRRPFMSIHTLLIHHLVAKSLGRSAAFFGLTLCCLFGASNVLGQTKKFSSIAEQCQQVCQDSKATWRTIPWQTDLLDAQKLAVELKKPLFVWAMDGHPLGCT